MVSFVKRQGHWKDVGLGISTTCCRRKSHHVLMCHGRSSSSRGECNSATCPHVRSEFFSTVICLRESDRRATMMRLIAIFTHPSSYRAFLLSKTPTHTLIRIGFFFFSGDLVWPLHPLEADMEPTGRDAQHTRREPSAHRQGRLH